MTSYKQRDYRNPRAHGLAKRCVDRRATNFCSSTSWSRISHGKLVYICVDTAAFSQKPLLLLGQLHCPVVHYPWHVDPALQFSSPLAVGSGAELHFQF
jgi:hypothetical protein